jgi:tRNA nucleotidyltransferase (CCA-adding enzyme)
VDDLGARRLRVLHDASFADDPTRLVRLARYAARLGFDVEPRTRELARDAFASGAPATAGRARMGNELLLALREPDPVAALVALRSLAGDAELDPGLDVDEAVLRRLAPVELPVDDGRPGRRPPEDRVAGGDPRRVPPEPGVLLAAMARRVQAERLREWLADVHVPDAAPVLDAADDPEGLAERMREARRPSDLWRLLRHRPPEAAAVAAAFGAEEPARRWLDELRHVRLAIGGDDLLAAGVPRGPEVGRRLEAALARKLDERLASREEELAAALASDA